MDLNNIYKKNDIPLPENLKKFEEKDIQVQKIVDFNAKDDDPSTHDYLLTNFCKGQIFCLFDTSQLEVDSKLSEYILVEEIIKIEEKSSDKKHHVLVHACDSGWNFIFENKEQQKNVLELFQQFKKFYTQKTQQLRNFKEGIDKMTIMKISSELQRRFWQQTNNYNKDLTSFFKDKKLKSIIERSNQFLIKSRVIAGKTKVFIKSRTDKEAIELKNVIIPEGSKAKFDVSIMGQDYDFYSILVTQKPNIIIEESQEAQNLSVTSRLALPLWMNFNTLYFFTYKGPGDVEQFKQGYNIADIQTCRFDEQKNDSLFMQLSDRIFVIQFQAQWFMEMFYYSMIQSKVCHYQQKRKNKQEPLNCDVEILYQLLEKKDKKNLRSTLQSFISDIDKLDNVDSLLAIMRKTTKNLDQFYEDFLTRLPFDFKLYNFVVYNIHKIIRQKLNDLWNNNFQNLQTLQILDIIKAFDMYFKLMEKYQIKDENFGTWVFDMISTLMSNTLQNYKKIITTIIKSMQNEQSYEILNQKVHIKSFEDINQQLNSVWSNYQYCSNKDTAIMLCEISSKLLQIFLTQIIKTLRENNDLKQNLYIALLNNSFIQILKSYQRKVLKDCKTFLNKQQVRDCLNEKMLIDMIKQVENISFYKIRDQSFKDFYSLADNDADFLQYDIEQTLQKCFESIKQLEEKIESAFKISELRQEFVKDVFYIYIKKTIFDAKKVTEMNLRNHIEKFEQDRETMQKITKDISRASQDLSFFITSQLREFFLSEDVSICNVCLINIQVYYPKLINIDNIRNILEAKIHFNQEQKDHIINYQLTSHQNNQEYIQKEKSYGKKIYHAYLVHKFALIFVKKYRNKKQAQQTSKTDDNQKTEQTETKQTPDKYTEPQISSNLSIKTIFEMRGNINFTKYASKYEDDKVIKYLKNKLKKPEGFKKAYIVFHLSNIVFYKNQQMKEVVFSMKYETLESINRLQKPKKLKKGEKPKDDLKQYVLFFKNDETGVGLYFKALNPNWIDQFEKALKAIKEVFSENKQEIKELNLTSSVPTLKWKQAAINYDYNPETYDKTGQNVIEFQDSEDEGKQLIFFNFQSFQFFLLFLCHLFLFQVFHLLIIYLKVAHVVKQLILSNFHEQSSQIILWDFTLFEQFVQISNAYSFLCQQNRLFLLFGFHFLILLQLIHFSFSSKT